MSGIIKPQDGQAIEKRLYTTKEVATFLRCSERTIFNRVKEGKIKPIRNGRLVLFTEESVENYLTLCSPQS